MYDTYNYKSILLSLGLWDRKKEGNIMGGNMNAHVVMYDTYTYVFSSLS